ncbi:MAG: hypothetical protein WD407_07930 [Rhodospirillales bacterium]
MRTEERQNIRDRDPLAPLAQDDESDFGFMEAEDPLDLGYEQGKIVAYDDDFSLNATILSIGWKDADSE